MFKILLKKEIMEINAWLFRSRKTGRFRTRSGAIGYSIFFFGILLLLSLYFFGIAFLLISFLQAKKCAWLGFAIMCMMAVMLGIFGSVFNTYEAIYRAKDNDLLLSMPIPPAAILTTKMLGVYLMGLLYISTVMIPTMIVWWMRTDFGFAGILFPILLYLLLSFFVLVLTCVLGYFVARIASRVRSRSFFTVMSSLVFFSVYYAICINAYRALQRLVEHTDEVRETFRSWLYPLYAVGRAAEGQVLPLIGVFLVVALLLFLTVMVMSRSFLRITTTNRGAKTKKYRERLAVKRNLNRTLLFREFRHLVSNANYMLNCAFSSALMMALAVFLCFRGDRVFSVLPEFLEIFPYGAELTPVLIFMIISLMASTNNMTAPSISLEGKRLWLIRSLPVETRRVLRAKLWLHELVTTIPAALLLVVCLAWLRPRVLSGILVLLLIVLYVMFTARFGLYLNLKMPNLEWKNETIPVKHSLSIFITLFGGWGFAVLLAVPSIVALSYVSVEVYLLILLALLLIPVLLLDRWIMRHGVEIFEDL